MTTPIRDYKDEINSLFVDNEFYEDWKVLKVKFPINLMNELDIFAEKCREIKDSPFKYLRFHDNERETSFQVSVPSNLFEESFTFAYLIHLGEFFVNKLSNVPYFTLKRKITFRKWQGHFDSYDFWAVFSYKNDRNLPHIHSAPISGIVYYSDSDIPTIFTNENNKELEIYGKKGDVVIFPGRLYHRVDEKFTDAERITFPFNLNYTSQLT